jgi:hypothetical protein
MFIAFLVGRFQESVAYAILGARLKREIELAMAELHAVAEHGRFVDSLP